jgi:subtilisin family serine protease
VLLDAGGLVGPAMISLAGTVTPNDPSFGSQWDLQNLGQNGGIAGADIRAPQAWAVTTGHNRVTVAVIDTGIDYDHPDLYQNVWINQAEIPLSRLRNLTDVDHDGLITFRDLNDPRNQGVGKITDVNHDGRIDAADILAPMVLDSHGNDTGQGGWAHGSTQDGDTAHPDDLIGWNFVNNTNNPFDDNGHGTHVSGTIGAVGGNGVGVTGIDWNVRIMALKFLDAGGTGSDGAAVDALSYAVRHGAAISNNSWGGGGNDPALANAIATAQRAGLIFVTAAGNAGSDIDVNPSYPASYNLDNIVSVAATDNRDQLAYFSNYGSGTVDLAAPGVNILSTTPNGTYSYYSGTSMATPHVTGVLALVWDLHPGWTYRQVINQVLNTTDPLPSLQGRTVTGGRLNAAAAVGLTNNVNPDDSFVQGLYQNLLGRTASASEIGSWASCLHMGVSRSQVAQAIWASAEHRGREVDQYFATYLHRAADRVGRANWVNAFRSGASESDVIAGFVTSGEYQALHPGDQAYVVALYNDLLGRTPDSTGLASWLAALRTGLSRQQLAQSILGSPEESRRVVQGYYASFLHRSADSPGLAGWLGQLMGGQADWSDVAAAILGSTEFYRVAEAG